MNIDFMIISKDIVIPALALSASGCNNNDRSMKIYFPFLSKANHEKKYEKRNYKIR